MVRQSEIVRDQLSMQGETMKLLEEVKKFEVTHSQKIINHRVKDKSGECCRCGLEHGFLCPAKNAKR